MLYAFFLVTPQRLNFICQRFGTLCPFHFHKRVGMRKFLLIHPPMWMEQTECSETLAYKIQTLRSYQEESTQHSDHGECLKSRTVSTSHSDLDPSGYSKIILLHSKEREGISKLNYIFILVVCLSIIKSQFHTIRN